MPNSLHNNDPIIHVIASWEDHQHWPTNNVAQNNNQTLKYESPTKPFLIFWILESGRSKFVSEIPKNICQRRGEYLWEDKKIFVSELGWWANSRIRKGASPTPCWLQTISEIFMKTKFFIIIFCIVTLQFGMSFTEQMTNILNCQRPITKVSYYCNTDKLRWIRNKHPSFFFPYSSAMINPPLTYCRKADIGAVKSTKSGVKDAPGRHHGNVIGVS